MPILRPPRLALVLPLWAACSGGESDDEGGSQVNGSGITVAEASAATPATTTSATDATGSAGSADTTAPPTSAADTSAGPSPDTSAADPSTTAPDPTTGFSSLSDSVSGTTYDSFGDTTEGEVCMQKIDVVFSMDVSTSMLGILQKLENEILSVDDKLKGLNVMADVHYGLVVFVDDNKIINNGAPYADVQTLKSDFNYWWNFTQTNQETNGGGQNVDWPENSIDALYTAAVAFQWRPPGETLRLVIHCTDDTFGDKGASLSGIIVQHSYDETVQALQDQQVRVFVFADADATGGQNNDQDVSPGFFTPYQGKPPIPEATDGGAFNINLVNAGQLSLGAAINDSVEQSLCMPYIPQ